MKRFLAVNETRCGNSTLFFICTRNFVYFSSFLGGIRYAIRAWGNREEHTIVKYFESKKNGEKNRLLCWIPLLYKWTFHIFRFNFSFSFLGMNEEKKCVAMVLKGFILAEKLLLSSACSTFFPVFVHRWRSMPTLVSFIIFNEISQIFSLPNKWKNMHEIENILISLHLFFLEDNNEMNNSFAHLWATKAKYR